MRNASLDEVFEYIARDDSAAARRWVARLVARAESMATLPLAGRLVPEFARDDVRETFERRYRIVYQVADSKIFILLVFHGRRLLPDLGLGDEDDDA